MAKLKALEAAKELGTNAGTLLENVLRIKKNATDTLSFLRRIDDQFKSREAKRKEEERREQERIRQENQRTAFIMDAPEETVDVVANEELGIGNEEGRGDRLGRPNLPIPQASRGLAPTTDDSSLTDSTPAAEALPTADAVAAQEVPAKPVVQAAEPPAQPAAEPKPAQTPPAVQTNFPQPGRIVRVDAKPTDKPKRQRDAAPQRPPRPQGQAAVSPSDYRAAERVLPPGTHAAYPLKPGIQGKMLPPRQPQSAAPRTENKTDAPRQTFAPRPFIPAQGPRPFTPAGQTTATGLPLRSYGGQAAPAGQRPFTPGQQRPFTPGGAQGGRPFTPGGQRPFTPGGAARPGGFSAGGAGRPGGFRKPEIAPAVEKERVSNYDPNKKQYIRQHDPEHIAKNRKQLARDAGMDMHDDDVVRGKRGKKRVSAQQMMEPIRIDKAFMTAETITVKDLSERIGKTAAEIMKKLLLLGTMATINQELDFDTASLVCTEFGVELEKKLDKTAEDILSDENFNDTEENLVPRPPVVTIMGHVDHGKTTLLDYIRKSRVAQGEAGGITQHIGAYQVDVNNRKVTFLDTPGHEAFTAMRARGATATDIVILVVAADDGVMPQTVEALNHARAAKVPIIVAITKIDKHNANIDRVKQDLVNRGVLPEEWGGDTIMTPVSAVTGENVDTLLEMILLVADMQQLRANPNRRARGVIIEAKLDRGRGPVATALVQNGTLHVGDMVVAGTAYGRIRAMLDAQGKRVDEAGPSTPVEIIGFGDVPDAGDDVMAVEDDRLSRQVAEERKTKARAAMVKSPGSKVSLDDLYTQISEGQMKDLNLIVKADVQGSVEAVTQSLERLSMDEVRVRVIHGGAGAITENDVMLASTASAIIIGFNVRPDNGAADLAKREDIDVRLYRVIYDAINDVEKAMKGLLAPEFKETVLGRAQVRQVFKVTGVGTIAGCYVVDGKILRSGMVRLTRDHIVVFEGKIASLKHLKDDAREIAQGFECGIGIERYNDVKVGDEIECYIKEEIAR